MLCCTRPPEVMQGTWIGTYCTVCVACQRQSQTKNGYHKLPWRVATKCGKCTGTRGEELAREALQELCQYCIASLHSSDDVGHTRARAAAASVRIKQWSRVAPSPNSVRRRVEVCDACPPFKKSVSVSTRRAFFFFSLGDYSKRVVPRQPLCVHLPSPLGQGYKGIRAFCVRDSRFEKKLTLMPMLDVDA